MKKIVLFIAFLMICSSATVLLAETDYTVIKLSLLPGISVPDNKIVNGFELGLLGTRSNQVFGLQVAPFYAKTVEISYGIQASLVALSDDFVGAKVWSIYSYARKMTGYQAAIVSRSIEMNGYQTGIVSMSDKLAGLQAGAVTITNEQVGAQIGLINISAAAKGLQLGLVNFTNSMEGVQIGLINIITKSKLPFMVLVNANF